MTRYYFEEEIKGESSRKIHYISATDGLAAIYVQEEDKDRLYYTYTDHLGSLVAIADEAGNPAERFSYDPWGNRRDPDDWTNRITTPVSEITGRGYTMHSLSRVYSGNIWMGLRLSICSVRTLVLP